MSLGLALVGLVVGIVVGLTSTGGGALLTPALVFLGIPPATAIGSDVLIASGMKLFGGGAYALRRDVHWPTVWRLAAGSIPGALLGILAFNAIPPTLLDGVLERALGGVLILAGLASLLRASLAGQVAPLRMPALPRTATIGFAIGFLVSLTSVGSGSLLLCALVLFFPLRPREMVGTDLVHALLLSSAATVGHLLSGRVDFALAGAVLVGGIPGVLIGARFAHLLPQRPLRTALAVMLLLIGVQLAVGPSLPAAHAAVAAVGPVAPVHEVPR